MRQLVRSIRRQPGLRLAIPAAVAAVIAFGACAATAAADADAAKPRLLALPEGAGVLALKDADSDAAPALCDVGVPATEARIPDACFSSAKLVTVTAVPDPGVPGARFDRWSDYRCPDTPECTIALTEDRSLTALFSPVFLRVKAGFFGPVTLTPPGNVCTFMPDALTGEDEPCIFPYERGSEVTLERDPEAATAKSAVWNGSCFDAAPTCRVKLLTDTYIRAGTAPNVVAFSPPGSTITLRRRGSGGSIQASKGQPRSCKKKSCPLGGVRDGDEIQLVATSSKNWKFARWENTSKNRKRFVEVGLINAAEATFTKKKKKK